MHIEFVEDEQDQVCECCAEMFDNVEKFVNAYIDANEEGVFTLESFADNLVSLYQYAKEQGRREALDEIGNIALNLAYSEDIEDEEYENECECDCG